MSDPEKKEGRTRKMGPPRAKAEYSPDVHRSLPQSLDAEKGVICSCLLAPSPVLDSCVNLPTAAFYHPANRLIFEEMLELHGAGKPVDFIMLTERLKYKGLPENATEDQRREYAGGLLDRAGGAAYISELFTFVPTASNADYYIEIVREKYHLRQLISLCTEFAGRGYTEQGEVKPLLDEFEQRVMSLGVIGADAMDAIRPAKVFVTEAVESLEAVYRHRGKPVGLETGFADFDRMTGGLKKRGMYVIAARPSMGKTVFAMNIAEHVSQTRPVLVFSCEMGGMELMERSLGNLASVNLQRWRDGFLSQQDVPKVMRAAKELAEGKLYIDESPGLTIMDLRARARRAKAAYGIELIVIDYLQLLRAPSKRAEASRQAEVADISCGIKAMAKELEIPVVVLAQLNRDPEKRSGNRPKVSDLRESGSIEQDADLIGLLNRPHKDEEKTPDEVRDFDATGEPATLVIGKQRNGPIGEIALKFFGKFTRFEGVTQAVYSNNPEERQR